ncbi:hypothetical protein BDA96_08G108400 [Sorghum bicolor]|uniref:Uncharacterized protein n=2 Tax=Sorghum bicolor TaxID=4558 RepID=A0A921QHB4_SORBI|nr:hypothetical protein BDA96_08G108400 [Sorghum bicolor]KXG23453.1 hypothetical protein SORBI_3008G097200 [Sorghum bicolor]
MGIRLRPPPSLSTTLITLVVGSLFVISSTMRVDIHPRSSSLVRNGASDLWPRSGSPPFARRQHCSCGSEGGASSPWFIPTGLLP